MDNIYDYIKADHKKVAGLFKQFEKAPSAEARKDFIMLIAKELIVHLEAEEETFYKELEKHKESIEAALHGDKEHTEIEQLITIVMNSMGSDDLLQENVKKLKELVEHHVSDEENKIFKQAKKIFSDEEAYILREQMHDRKEKILTQQAKELKNLIGNKFEKTVK